MSYILAQAPVERNTNYATKNKVGISYPSRNICNARQNQHRILTKASINIFNTSDIYKIRSHFNHFVILKGACLKHVQEPSQNFTLTGATVIIEQKIKKQSFCKKVENTKR